MLYASCSIASSSNLCSVTNLDNATTLFLHKIYLPDSKRIYGPLAPNAQLCISSETMTSKRRRNFFVVKYLQESSRM